MIHRVLIPLAQGCEELEAVTLVDLLRRAKIEVVTAGLDNNLVTASRGTVLQPDTTLDKVDSQLFTMIALPGGQPGANHLGDDSRIIELLQTFYSQGKYIAAICAAPKVLARAGLLRGKKATSFPGSLSAAELEGVDYVEHSIVHDGTIITSRGPGTAMDFALYLIELLLDRERRDHVEQSLQREPLTHRP